MPLLIYHITFFSFSDSLIKGMEADTEEERAEAMGKVDQYLDKITSLPKSDPKSVNRTVINKYKDEDEQVFENADSINIFETVQYKLFYLITSGLKIEK